MKHLRKIGIIKLTTIAVLAMIIAACGSSKKAVTSAVGSTPSSTSTKATPANNYLFVRPDGIHAPGNEELAAIQVQYKDITLDRLKEGHEVYISSACIQCHNAKNIYQIEEAKWKDVMDDMAQKAHISDVQKDAVYKYVLAIKATQPK